MNELIKEHHSLFLKKFEFLKPKFHMLLHYYRLMLLNGPLSKLSTQRMESKHTEIKKIANQSNCRKNLPKTISIRYLLKNL